MSDQKPKTLPAAEVTINFKGNDYKVKFPNSGQFVDIELSKSSISSNGYTGLFSSTISAEWARHYIDTVATFNVLIPQLSEDLNAKSILSLEMTDSILLVKEYRKKFLPWYNEWMILLTGDDE